MTIQKIKGDDYSVNYDPNTRIIHFSGDLSLEGAQEYQSIAALLESATHHQSSNLTLDLKELTFLNSSGISMLSKFVLSLRPQKEIKLTILGSPEIPWQGKSLKNLQKFLPTLQLEVD